MIADDVDLDRVKRRYLDYLVHQVLRFSTEASFFPQKEQSVGSRER